MAKFGLFGGTGNQLDTYEGDYMTQKDEYVYIKKRVTQPGMADEQVAAIRLKEGTSVKKISE
jgi:hypothetical protein